MIILIIVCIIILIISIAYFVKKDKQNGGLNNNLQAINNNYNVYCGMNINSLVDFLTNELAKREININDNAFNKYSAIQTLAVAFLNATKIESRQYYNLTKNLMYSFAEMAIYMVHDLNFNNTRPFVTVHLFSFGSNNMVYKINQGVNTLLMARVYYTDTIETESELQNNMALIKQIKDNSDLFMPNIVYSGDETKFKRDDTTKNTVYWVLSNPATVNKSSECKMFLFNSSDTHPKYEHYIDLSLRLLDFAENTNIVFWDYIVDNVGFFNNKMYIIDYEANELQKTDTEGKTLSTRYIVLFKTLVNYLYEKLHYELITALKITYAYMILYDALIYPFSVYIGEGSYANLQLRDDVVTGFNWWHLRRISNIENVHESYKEQAVVTMDLIRYAYYLLTSDESIKNPTISYDNAKNCLVKFKEKLSKLVESLPPSQSSMQPHAIINLLFTSDKIRTCFPSVVSEKYVVNYATFETIEKTLFNNPALDLTQPRPAT